MSTRKKERNDLFSQEARKARKTLKITRTAFAKLCGVARQTCINWELKKRVPDFQRQNLVDALQKKSDDWAEKAAILREILNKNGGESET